MWYKLFSLFRELLLPPSLLFSITPVLNSSCPVQGSFTFSLISWSPALYLLAPTTFTLKAYQFFSAHFHLTRGILVSAVKLFNPPVALICTSLTIPPVFLKILHLFLPSEYAKSPSLILSPLSLYVLTWALSDLIYFQGYVCSLSIATPRSLPLVSTSLPLAAICLLHISTFLSSQA